MFYSHTHTHTYNYLGGPKTSIMLSNILSYIKRETTETKAKIDLFTF